MAAAVKAAAWADLVEIRADFIRDLSLRRLLRKKSCPVLFTLRSRREGGSFQGPERKRLECILEAAQLGADYVDIEYSAFWQVVLATVPPRRVVLSYHCMDGIPSDLEALAESMAATGAGVVKIAVRAKRLADNVRLLRLLEDASSRGLNLCVVAMGSRGVPSRVLGPSWGSWMTFAGLPGGEAAADGQIPADLMTGRYRVREIGPATQLFGLVGNPLGHSLSPALHNALFAADKRDAVYLPLEAESFADFLEFDAAVPVRGASVTIPFKECALEAAAAPSSEAEAVGAVNTLIAAGGLRRAENTDVGGFIRPLRERALPAGLRALVLGAGGAARAAIHGLRLMGMSVCVVSRTAARARSLAACFQAEWSEWERIPELRWDLLVNTTPVGSQPHADQTPVRAADLTGGWVYDLVYNPMETRLLREAAGKGCGTISGLEMFLEQAAEQQRLWFGKRPQAKNMREAIAPPRQEPSD